MNKNLLQLLNKNLKGLSEIKVIDIRVEVPKPVLLSKVLTPLVSGLAK